MRPVSTVEYTFTSDDVADDVDEGRYTSHDVSAATGFRLPLTDAEENVEAIIDLLFGVGTFFDEDNYEQNSQLLRISPSMTIPLGESQGSIYLNLDQSWWINDNTHHTYLNVYWEKEW